MKGCLFMSQYVNVSNSWRNTKYTYVNVNGSWKSCNNIYVNNNGTWRPLHAYWWNIGGWGGCSASCGGGWQYRTVNCYRSHSSNHGLDQLAMDDSYCTRNVGTKPATQQQCNTHSCADCQYNQPGVCYSGIYNTYWSDVEAWNYTFVLWNDDNCSINGALYNGNFIGIGGTINKNGYIYFRGNLQRSDSSSGVVVNDYSVCRQPG